MADTKLHYRAMRLAVGLNGKNICRTARAGDNKYISFVVSCEDETASVRVGVHGGSKDDAATGLPKTGLKVGDMLTVKVVTGGRAKKQKHLTRRA